MILYRLNTAYFLELPGATAFALKAAGSDMLTARQPVASVFHAYALPTRLARNGILPCWHLGPNVFNLLARGFFQ